MTQEERNKWLLDNMDVITSTIHRYCGRDPELDYDDIYSEIMEYLIKRLDQDHSGKYQKMKSCEITQKVGNRIHSVRGRAKPNEELHDPADFEELYFPDLESGITKWEYDSVPMSERERIVFDKYITGDYTLDEIADEFNVTRERVRQIFSKACKKVFWKKVYKKGKEKVYFRVRFNGNIYRGICNRTSIKGDSIVMAFDEDEAIEKVKRNIKKTVGLSNLYISFYRDCYVKYFIETGRKNREYLKFDCDISELEKSYALPKADSANKDYKSNDPLLEEFPGFLAYYDLEFRYKRSDDENILVKFPVGGHKLVNHTSNFSAWEGLKSVLKLTAAKAVKGHPDDIEILHPVSINEVVLKKVIFMRRPN